MIQIAEMVHLTKLYLDNTNISDDGIQLLKNHQYLNYLNINNTLISNTGIESLYNVESLQTIFAYQTKANKEELGTDIKIETGNYKLKSYANDTIRIPES